MGGTRPTDTLLHISAQQTGPEGTGRDMRDRRGRGPSLALRQAQWLSTATQFHLVVTGALHHSRMRCAIPHEILCKTRERSGRRPSCNMLLLCVVWRRSLRDAVTEKPDQPLQCLSAFFAAKTAPPET